MNLNLESRRSHCHFISYEDRNVDIVKGSNHCDMFYEVMSSEKKTFCTVALLLQWLKSLENICYGIYFDLSWQTNAWNFVKNFTSLQVVFKYSHYNDRLCIAHLKCFNCHIKPKIFLRPKLLESLILEKQAIYVPMVLSIFVKKIYANY